VAVDYGSPFLLFIGYDIASYEFDVLFNDDQIDPYIISATPDDLVFEKVYASGGMDINYIGFGPKGWEKVTKIKYK
jgi:hypothetical protein